MGGTGLEPVTPSLSNLSGRSRAFAPVRKNRIITPNVVVDRTPERTPADAERCHCCHAPGALLVAGACRIAILSGERLRERGGFPWAGSTASGAGGVWSAASIGSGTASTRSV
jgi:hypothetical protein